MGEEENELKMKLIILAFEDDPVQRLINWANFHRMEYILCYENLNEISGYNIIITGDLVPSTRIFKYIFEGEEVGTPFNFIKDKSSTYRPSFCALTKETLDGEYFPIYKRNLKIVDIIAHDKIHPDLGGIYHMCHNSWSRYDILWSVVVGDWYKGDTKYVSKLYFYYWIESYHKDYLKTGNIRDVPWIREQCLFSGVVDREEIEGVKTMQEFRKLIDEHEYKFNDILNGIKAKKLNIDVTPSNFSLHPFSIRGFFRGNPVKRVEIDKSITVVAFYYNLGYGNKTREQYVKSLEYFCLLQYPVVFFGDKDICDIVREKRGELLEYTLIVEKPAEEWELIKKYKDDYAEMDFEINFRERRRYSILTCNKVYAIMEAIKINPFFTTNFAWIDPGFYKHDLATGIKLEPMLLKNLKIPENKIITPTISTAGGTSHEEYTTKAHELCITCFIIGNINSWNNFYKVYDTVVMMAFDKRHFTTEQVVFSRIMGLHPDLFEFGEFSYLGEAVNKFLSLEWEV